MKTYTLYLVLFISTLSAQNKQVIILGEDFDGMSSIKWPLQNDATVSSNIKNDFYNIDIKDAESYGCFSTAAKINEKGDYTINTKIAAVKLTGTESLYGLVWGAKAKDENFLFLINPAKKIYAIYKYAGGKLTPIFAWTKCEKIKNDTSPNELRITKMSGNWFFSINGADLKKTPIQPFFGTSLGIYTIGKINIKVDNLYVSSEK